MNGVGGVGTLTRDELRALMAGYDLPDVSDVLNRPAWHADAACREHPELTWFPVRGESARPAKAVCAGCLVRGECSDYAETIDMSPPLAGIWAGTSARDRLRGVSEPEPPVPPHPCGGGCGRLLEGGLARCSLCRSRLSRERARAA